MADELQSSSGGAHVCDTSAACVPLMPEQLTLSQSAWTLLDMLQQQLGVTIEVLDMSMRPISPGLLPDVPSAIEEPRIAAETLKSLRTGELRIDRTTGVPVAIFPLRVAKQVAGCLVVSARPRGADEAPAAVNVEGAAHLVRSVLESDLALTSELAEARYRNRRVHGVLRFLAQLGGTGTEREVMSAVIQAATVWFDVDCRIYARQPDESYTLAAVLPGVERRTAGARLDSARVERLVASRRFPSGGDLDDLGLAGRREEVLVLPVGDPVAPEWLLILAGTIDQDVELTFAAIAKVLLGDLLARETARADAWRQRLAGLSGAPGAPERTLLAMLEALATEVGATAARVTLVSAGAERALAALGDVQEPGEGPAPAAELGGAEIYETSQPITADEQLRLSLASRRDRRDVAQQASSWMKALQPWLREAVARFADRTALFDEIAQVSFVEVSPFERRIQEEIERAKRFNLGLGLVLIAPEPGGPAGPALDPLLPAVRSELRASDLMGRIRGGVVAVLLVHAEPAGAESVITRIRHRLGELPEQVRVTTLQLGRAVFSPEFATADALIAEAQRQVQRFELSN